MIKCKVIIKKYMKADFLFNASNQTHPRILIYIYHVKLLFTKQNPSCDQCYNSPSKHQQITSETSVETTKTDQLSDIVLIQNQILCINIQINIHA